MSKKFLFSILLLLLGVGASFLLLPLSVFAQTPGSGEQIENLVLPTYGTGEGATLLAKLVAQALSSAFIIAGAIMLIMILWSGIAWITAGDNENNLKGARQRLVNAIIGFAILVGLRAIMGFIGDVFEVGWLKTLKIVWPIP